MTSAPPQIPTGVDLADELSALTLPYPAVPELLQLADRLTDEQRATVLRGRDFLAGEFGNLGYLNLAEKVPIPADGSVFGRLGYVLMFVSALPAVREFHRERGIDDAQSRLILSDLGRHASVYHTRYGVNGFAEPSWMELHFTGKIYQLGRLQYERGLASAEVAEAATAAGLPLDQGQSVLSLHIPRYQGPLSAVAVDESIDRARGFFTDHFPEERYPVAICTSWLLDPQLAEHLGAQANIPQFASRFQLVGEPTVDRTSALDFTFDQPDLPLEQLPQRSRLERAVVQVLRSGGSWHSATGWFAWNHEA